MSELERPPSHEADREEDGEGEDQEIEALTKRRRFEDEGGENRRERQDRMQNESDADHHQQQRESTRQTPSSSGEASEPGKMESPSSQQQHSSSSQYQPANSPAGDDKVELRLLIDGALVGAVIGRQGATIKRIREETSAYVNVLQDPANPAVRERVMVVRASMPSVLQALGLLVEVMTESLRVREQRGGGGVENEPPQAKLTLLVHRITVGAIIGKGGDTIKTTQNESGARVNISGEVLSGSTEKSVTIMGSKSNVMQALERVVQQIHSSQLKPGTSDIPYQPGMGMPLQPYAGSVGLGRDSYYPPHQQVPQRFGGDDRRSFTGDRGGYSGGYNGGMPPIGGGGNFGGRPPMGDEGGPITEQKIAIPSVCAGCVIGRGGEVIKQLRVQSGCAIQVESQDQSTNAGERVVVIKGSQAAIQAAVRLIRQCVENYRPPPQRA